MVAVTGKLVANRYRLEHQVGEGGMATVWVAEDEKLERWVALKLLGRNYLSSRSVRERFAREAMAIAKLRSPHIVEIYDYGTDVDEAGNEIAFIAMELLSGEDLYDWLKNNRPVALEQVARIVGQVARGLAAAHRAGIVHRDLKPANIFVVRDHEEEIVKVFDFGLARGFRDHSQLRELRDRTGEGVLLGTPRYMSPEQAHGAREVDHRADLWSLAVIAYLAVTGRLPFEGTGVGEVVTKIATQGVTAPSTLVKGVGPELDAFFAKALAKDPDDRFQSATELALALQEVVGGSRSSRDLIPLGDGDTEVELTRADTEVSGPASEDAPTLEQRKGDPLVEPPAEPPARPAALDGASPDATRAARTSRRWRLPAAVTVVAGLVVLAVTFALDRGGPQRETSVRVPARNQQTALEPPPARSVAVADSSSTPSVTASAGDVAASSPSVTRPPPSTSASAAVSERGLELFDDRH